MKYHIAAFFLGFLLDLLLGDPHCFPHPVRLIGNLITALEMRLLGKTDRGSNRDGGNEKKEGDEKNEGNARNKGNEDNRENERSELNKGILLAAAVPAATAIVAALFFIAAYRIHPYLGLLTETIMTYQILATKCLKTESMKVYKCLVEGGGRRSAACGGISREEGLEAARKAVSMIVGRDTAVLDEEGVAKAAIETVAENTSDGVIAPMIYTAIGGPVLGFFYKAVNTMDSMVGYKNDKYLYFGRAAAKLDDLINYIPARISAYLMILAAFLGGGSFDGKRAYKIYKRDNRNHASPNSAQTESVCAGALGLQLAGDAVYFGKVVKKPYIGDALRSVEYEDIRRVNRLMYLTAWISEIICLFVLISVCLLAKG